MTFLSDEDMVRIVETKNPETVEELIQIVEDEYSIARQNIIDSILRLEQQRKLVFETDPRISKPTVRAYLMSGKGVWYPLVIALSLMTLGMVFTLPRDAYPLICIRYIFGSFFVLLLPGYSLNRALFKVEELGGLERAGLSIGISITLASLVGLLLNFTPWGIRIVPITLSLLALTAAFATIGLLREKEITNETQ